MPCNSPWNSLNLNLQNPEHTFYTTLTTAAGTGLGSGSPPRVDAGVDAVREREVDDAELAAEIDRGLRPGLGELLEPAAASSGEHQCHGILYRFPVNHRCAPSSVFP